MIKKLYFWYQRVVWYTGHTYGEWLKLGRFLNESLLLSLVAKSLGFKVTIWRIVLFNLVLVIIAAIIGKFLVIVGVVRYNNLLANKQNDIKDDLEKIKKHLGI